MKRVTNVATHRLLVAILALVFHCGLWCNATEANVLNHVAAPTQTEDAADLIGSWKDLNPNNGGIYTFNPDGTLIVKNSYVDDGKTIEQTYKKTYTYDVKEKKITITDENGFVEVMNVVLLDKNHLNVSIYDEMEDEMFDVKFKRV